MIIMMLYLAVQQSSGYIHSEDLFFFKQGFTTYNKNAEFTSKTSKLTSKSAEFTSKTSKLTSKTAEFTSKRQTHV